MNELKFRTLRADEIECRIGQVSKQGKGLSLLLYKNARVDMALLDETVGPMNWQRQHLNGNTNCVISIWDTEKQQWIKKEDVGSASDIESAKGLASDSFKRCAVSWGIGRELYSAPFIWITSDNCNIRDGKCYDHFFVGEIEYDVNRNISYLTIVNDNGQIVFRHGRSANVQPAPFVPSENVAPRASKARASKSKANTAPAQPAPEGISAAQIVALRKKYEAAGVTEEKILANYNIDKISQLSAAQYENAVKKLDAGIKARANTADVQQAGEQAS